MCRLERMLYYSGYINRIGEVHDGDTVMDYLDQVGIIYFIILSMLPLLVVFHFQLGREFGKNLVLN